MYILSEIVFKSIQKELDLQNKQYGNLNVRIHSEEMWGDIIDQKIRVFWRDLLLDLDPEMARITMLELIATGICLLQQYGVVEKAEYCEEERLK